MQKMNMLGKGNTAEVFEYEKGKVCKLFFKDTHMSMSGWSLKMLKKCIGMKLAFLNRFKWLT